MGTGRPEWVVSRRIVGPGPYNDDPAALVVTVWKDTTMAPTVPHILLTVHGTLPGGEVWTCGLRTYNAPTFLSTSSGAALAAAAANRWMTFRNSRSDLFANLTGKCATVDGVTLRELDVNGLTVTQYEGVPTTALTVSTEGQSAANQNALAVTLLTTRAGRTGKGRIYLPCLNQQGMFTNGQLLPGVITAVAASVKTLLDGINTDIATHFGSALKLAVQSPTAAKAWFDDNSLADYNGAVITAFKIGTAVDTQRRRRSSLTEAYTQLALA
jgi:hypothetical protein